MEVSAIEQLFKNQLVSRQSSGTSDNSFAQLLAAQLLGSSDESGTAGSSLATSLLSGALGDDAGEEDGLSSSLLMLFMMGMGSNLSGDSFNMMMSSLANARKGDASYSAMSNPLSGILNAKAYGTYNTNGLSLYNNTYVYNPNSNTSIPASPSVAVNPVVTSNAYNRSASQYRQVIDQFDVENNVRYSPKNGGTYCNIFLWDVTRAMGAEIPHYVDPDTMEPRYYPDVKGAMGMTANRIYDWLGQKGNDYGWREVSAQEAQSLANAGHPVVTAYKNPGGHGHVQVVCPSKDGTYNAKKGVTVAQAGSHLYDYKYITDVFGSKSLSKVKYYAHA